MFLNLLKIALDIFIYKNYESLEFIVNLYLFVDRKILGNRYRDVKFFF